MEGRIYVIFWTVALVAYISIAWFSWHPSYRSLYRGLPVAQNSTKETKEGGALASEERVYTIYGATKIWQNIAWSDIFDFKGCEYSNCVCSGSKDARAVERADIVMFAKAPWVEKFPQVPWQIRQHQYWFMMTTESGVFERHVFPQRFNNRFNGTMMYRRDSSIYYPFGKTEPIASNLSMQTDFPVTKTKGAFGYVSNCRHGNYERLDLMEELTKYIQIDIFSRTCSKRRWPHVSRPLCDQLDGKDNLACETSKHTPYHFFLAFENSLCYDYITEKFWDRLSSPSYFVPVVMGGLSMDDYTRVAPPDSFIHVYNFTSVRQLGEYLQYLMDNESAYNRYHQWRKRYRINTGRNLSACEMCKLANLKPPMPGIKNIAGWRNNASLCRTYKIH